ncbi:MAG: GlsB/YeaQ/YmgE family stress response membrane protein [Rhodomicrobiaceae bacterium]
MIIEILVVPLVCGIVAGWLGGLVTRGSGFGPIGNMIAAIIAAVLAAWLLRATGLTLVGSIADAIVASLAGAFLTLAIIGEMRR